MAGRTINVFRLPDVAFKATTRGVLFVILIVTEEKKRSPEKADAGSFRNMISTIRRNKDEKRSDRTGNDP